MQIREPAVAGMFYPANEQQLRREVEALLSAAATTALHTDCTPKALIVPHAGYVYSGATAAKAYHLLQPLRETIKRVLLLGPAHRVYLQGMAIPATRHFRTPLGPVALDIDALDDVAALPGVEVSDAAHAEEHCLEVQLPFLQLLLADFSLIPVVVGKCDPQRVAGLIDSLWGNEETLVLISSDLSHFLPYAEARRMDQQTERRILDKASTLSGSEACGAQAINGLMRARHTGPLAIETVALCNSGDTAGDKSRVVGYGSFVVH